MRNDLILKIKNTKSMSWNPYRAGWVPRGRGPSEGAIAAGLKLVTHPTVQQDEGGGHVQGWAPVGEEG